MQNCVCCMTSIFCVAVYLLTIKSSLCEVSKYEIEFPVNTWAELPGLLAYEKVTSHLISDLSEQFCDEFMVSAASKSSSSQHDVHVVTYDKTFGPRLLRD